MDGIYYNINGNEATVTYRGSYPSHYSNEYSGHVTIPTTITHNGLSYNVTSIGDDSFEECSGLTSVTIPNSVISIGSAAFSGCSSLNNITIPNSVTSIGIYAFNICFNLNSVSIPNSVTSIGDYAFALCDSLTSFTLPNSITHIGEGAFSYCIGLSSVNIPSSVTAIGERAFEGCCNMKRVDIMNINSWCRTKFGDIDSNPLSYANHLFLDGMEINDLIIPDDVTTINKFAFFGMNGLNSVTIGNAVTAICDSAFMNSDMKRLNIGNSVTNIGEDTFTVSTLEIVNISDIKAWCNIKFGKEDSYRPLWSNPLVRADHLYLNGVEVKDLIIPNDVDIIGDYAFSYCKSLTSVTISNSVISIGRLAFAFCDEITTATICDSLSTIGYDYTYIDDFAFYGCEKLAKVFFGESVAAIGDCAFQGCTSLDTIFFNAINCENFKTDIGEWMEPCTGTWGHDAHPFYNLNISNIYLGDNVQRIPANFAYDFKRLTCITIPNSVYYIGPDAFSRCSGLTQVSIMDIESWCYIWFGNAAANPLLYAHHLFLNGEEIKDLVIPDSITVINKYAFYGCRGLTSVSIPNSVTEIGIGAFEECTGLKRVNITDLNSWCSIKFGHLDDFVSYGSNPLESAHHLFLKGEEIKDLVIPNNITTINLNTFYKCSGLTSITIPNSVTSIGHFAFCECSGLTSIIIPNSVSSIGDWAFYGCNNLATVFLTGDGEWVTASLLNNYTFLSVASF